MYTTNTAAVLLPYCYDDARHVCSGSVGSLFDVDVVVGFDVDSHVVLSGLLIYCSNSSSISPPKVYRSCAIYSCCHMKR